MWGIIVALISGALMSVQGVFNTGVTKQTSTWLASAWVAFSGFVVAIALWAIFERNQAGIFSLAPGRSQIYAARRCDRCLYYMDRYYSDGRIGTGEGSAADCDLAAIDCVPD